ncbi:hypothetical protein PRIPAC_90445 [Pristionchus pacificus]|uniref:Uncharacterized protein n=1 Tax=Pristionchus pacificus TaxID=54126 RepID=A0A2A6CX82_PRIPA|nr:hypothetical protein PRIPAC_90445 [Pristionchus pacificus]|eukprot:PDM82785.1 hypothetical protein PRIPAC_37178 [Pristionchus pacificus]
MFVLDAAEFEHIIEHRKNCEDELKKLTLIIEKSEKEDYNKSLFEWFLIKDARNRVAYLEEYTIDIAAHFDIPKLRRGTEREKRRRGMNRGCSEKIKSRDGTH